MSGRKKINVLFISIKNSARSQMAEAFLENLAPEQFQVSSAGTSPDLKINPIAVEVMREIGIDISNKEPKGLLNYLPHTGFFDYIITICDKDEDIRCPAFSDKTKKLHWNIQNPEIGESYDEKIEKMREIRDIIAENVRKFVEEVKKIKDF